MIIFDGRKKIASNWEDEKWVTQKIQHILKVRLKYENKHLQVYIYIGIMDPFLPWLLKI